MRAHLGPDRGDDNAALRTAACALAEPTCAHRYEELASVHLAAPLMVSTLTCGLGPYSLDLNNNHVYDASTRLRASGTIFKAAKRGSWAFSDPLLAAWAGGHAPPSMRRKLRAPRGHIGPRFAGTRRAVGRAPVG